MWGSIRWTFVVVVSFAIGSQALAQGQSPAPGSAASMQQSQADIENLSSQTENERQSEMLDAAAEAAGAVAKAVEEKDTDKAREKTRTAIVLLAEATRECASVSPLVGPLAEAMGAQRPGYKGLEKNIKDLFRLIDIIKAAKSSSGSGSFDGSMAIREIIIGIYDITDGTPGDISHVFKALDWLVNSTLGGFSAEAFSEALDYLIERGYIRAEDKADIEDAARDLADNAFDDGKTSNDRVTEIRRIKDMVHEESRRQGRERRAQLEEEDHQDTQQDTQVPDPERRAPQPTTAVQLTSLEGPTEVSRRTMGEVQSIHFVANDGTEFKPEQEPEFSDHKDSFTLTINWDPRASSVIFGGTAGTVEIFQDRWAADTPFFGPRDREIVTRNTSINETIAAKSPTGEGLITGPLDDYAITIDGQPVDIVAVQPDEIAVQATGVQPNPSGQSDIVLTENGQPIATGTFDSWGYTISAPEVTERNVWIPIYIQVTGVAPTQLLRITLTPTPGQTIEPKQIVVSGAEAMERVQISRLMTEKLGPQLFFVSVEKSD